MPVRYSAAPEVADIAAELITEHHDHLTGVPIVYVFRSHAAKSNGRVILGRARRVNGLNAFLAMLAAGEEDADDHTFFVMEIAHDHWCTAEHGERVALVDHELCHFDVDPDDGSLLIRGHDMEEFLAVVHRHGLWREDVAAFAAVCGAVA